MKPQIDHCRQCIDQVVQLFHTAHHVAGDFRLMFHPANPIPDSDGNTVIDGYLFPVDAMAKRHAGDSQSLHLQILGSTIPPECIGYDFNVRIVPQADGSKVKAVLCDVDWKDDSETRKAFEVLNTN